MRWPGFRRVRGQVCKRLQRRIHELDVGNIDAYRQFLQRDPAEWTKLDELCRVSISRFYRDKAVFAYLETSVLPSLIRQVQKNNETELRVWCVGGGAGEEPFTLAVVWSLQIQPTYPAFNIRIIATDADENQLQRAQQACYTYSSIKALPAEWTMMAFGVSGDRYCLRDQYRANVEFLCQDVRDASPPGVFHLILCRNLAFTYFDEPLQTEISQRLHASLASGGALVIGVHEALPPQADKLFETESKRLRVYRPRAVNTQTE
jgi:chemotaxis protein methyltransferase CheR